MTERFTIIPAVYLVLIKDGKILLLRRKNTGFEDGNYSMVSGHLEGNETIRHAMIREAREEAGITIQPQDLALVHIMHRQTQPERSDFFLTTSTWDGEITNKEPEKCDDLSWFSLTQLPENTIPYIRQAIEHIQAGQVYSEHGW